jgi:hypothetical protein
MSWQHVAKVFLKFTEFINLRQNLVKHIFIPLDIRVDNVNNLPKFQANIGISRLREILNPLSEKNALTMLGIDPMVVNTMESTDGINSVGVLEVPKVALEELLVNALVHCDYFVSASVRIFIFDKLKAYPDIEFVDDRTGNQFQVIITRKMG